MLKKPPLTHDMLFKVQSIVSQIVTNPLFSSLSRRRIQSMHNIFCRALTEYSICSNSSQFVNEKVEKGVRCCPYMNYFYFYFCNYFSKNIFRVFYIWHVYRVLSTQRHNSPLLFAKKRKRN